MKTVIVALWLVIIIGLSSWAFFVPGMFYLHDFLHSARISEMAGALQDGHFPVRWSKDFGYGYGMPLFEFYAPLPYYVGAIFYLAGLPVLVATKILFVLATVATAFGSYLLGKRLYGRAGGLVTAAAVTLAPYRAVNLFVRGALSETWGIMSAVWILYFSYIAIKGSRKAWLGLTIALTILFLSHNVMTLLFVPFSLLFGCVLFVYELLFKQEKKQLVWFRGVKIVLAYIFAGAMSLFYVLPALVEKNFTKVEQTITGGYFDYNLHFLYIRQLFIPSWNYGGSNWGPDDGISFFLGFAQLITLVLGFLFLVHQSILVIKKKKTTVSKEKLFMLISTLILLIVSLLLTTQKSLALWNSVQVLQFVQFPWRFLSVSLILVGMLAPTFLLRKMSFVKRWIYAWFVLLVMLVNGIYFRPESWLDNPSLYYTDNEAVIQEELSKTLPDYLPSAFQGASPENGSELACIVACESFTSSRISNKTQEKQFLTTSSAVSQVVIGIANFPGWEVFIDDVPVQTSTVNGLVSVSVPSGKHLVQAQFKGTPIRSLADRVSLGSLIIFVGVCLRYYWQEKKYGKK